MSSFWATDDGWPYEDSRAEAIELDGEPDDELLSLATSHHLMDGLNEIERIVLTARFGLAGQQVSTMRELQASMGLPRSALRDALGSGLAKLRANLGVDPARIPTTG